MNRLPSLTLAALLLAPLAALSAGDLPRTIQLDPALDARGFKHVKLQGPDDDEDFWNIFDTLEKDPELDRLIDQKGTFEVVARPGGGNCIAQIMPEQGILWDHAGKLPLPHTLFGDTGWSDTAIEAEVLVSGGHVAIGARYAHRTKLGWHLTLTIDTTTREFTIRPNAIIPIAPICICLTWAT